MSANDLSFNSAECFLSYQNYEAAITEYKRFIFFNPQSESVSLCHYKIGLAYKNQRKWKESIDALKKSIQSAPTDSIKMERELALAIIQIASGDYSDAEFRLLRLELFGQNTTLRRRASFFRGVVSLYTYKWNDARSAFQNYFKEDSSANGVYLFLRLDSMLAKAISLKYKSAKLAKVLSTILPGGGQIYAGKWQDGFNALAINGVIGYLLVNSLIKKNYCSFISLFPLFQRYYQGNRYRAEKITENYNEYLNKQFAEQILEIILNEQNQ